MNLRAKTLRFGTALAAIPLMILGPAAFSHAATATAPSSGATATHATATHATASHASASAHTTERACSATPKPHHAACNALHRTDIASVRALKADATPSGLGGPDIQSAYNLGGASADGRTVAIVDAYDDPTAEADLATYRSQYGLPACTTDNGCFKKIDQNGGSDYPKTDGGWAQEISLDLDMVSAACPTCNILLVEADSASFADLGAAVDQAADTEGVVAISNSYGGSDAADSDYGDYYNHPGIAVTVSAGDSGYEVEYPASSQYVTAVGGTSLTQDSSDRGWSETVWDGSGSGCSDLNPALSGQSSADTGCDGRAVADVSAVADPNTGVAVYDSTAYQGSSGWMVFGGTSASAPIIASVYALAGNTDSIDNNYPYSHADALNDVTSGSNGSCPTTQWCEARTGWDGPTGLGTPNGTDAF